MATPTDSADVTPSVRYWRLVTFVAEIAALHASRRIALRNPCIVAACWLFGVKHDATERCNHGCRRCRLFCGGVGRGVQQIDRQERRTHGIERPARGTDDAAFALICSRAEEMHCSVYEIANAVVDQRMRFGRPISN